MAEPDAAEASTSSRLSDRGPGVSPLPAALMSRILLYVGIRTVVRCAMVCREWRDAADHDYVWRRACAARWRNKKNVPKIDDVTQLPSHLYPDARYVYPENMRLADLKAVLRLRRVEVGSFLEKSEFERAIIETQARDSVGGWRGAHRFPWKASYAYALHEGAYRKTISREQLVGKVWELRMRLQQNDEEERVFKGKFHADGQYETRPLIMEQPTFNWDFLPYDNPSRSESFVPEAERSKRGPPRYRAVRIGHYPELYVERAVDFGFVLSNRMVSLVEVDEEW